MTVTFVLDGQEYAGINGGPQFPFTEAVSLMVNCADQAEVDYYWERLSSDGGQESVCGWLKDRYGLSWQVVPTGWEHLLTGPDQARAARAPRASRAARTSPAWNTRPRGGGCPPSAPPRGGWPPRPRAPPPPPPPPPPPSSAPRPAGGDLGAVWAAMISALPFEPTSRHIDFV